jgi:Major Facilitator Superfamily
MPSFHAAWSLGGLAGSALGGLAAPALSPLSHFSLVCALGLVVTVTCGRVILTWPLPPAHEIPGHEAPAADVQPPGEALPAAELAGEEVPSGSMPCPTSPAPPASPARPAAQRAPSVVWRTVLLLGVIALCSTYGEGAISDWGALHLHADLGAAAGLAAAGYASFALAEAAGRLAGTWLLDRLGQTRVLVYGGLVTCAGMLAAALSPVLPLALAGFALTGLGVANAFPTAMSRVGLLAGPNGVATASTLGYAGFLLGPPIIGFLATGLSLRIALTTVSLLAVVAIVLARAASTAAG